MDIGKSWNFLETVLAGGDGKDVSTVHWDPVVPSQELRDAVYLLGQEGIPFMLEEWLAETIFQSLNDVVGDGFWNLFNNQSDGAANVKSLCDAFEYLFEVYDKQYLEAVRRIKWLHMLAVSSPACPASESNSAFTPVNGRGGQTKTKAVWFEQPEFQYPPQSKTGLHESDNEVDSMISSNNAPVDYMDLGEPSGCSKDDEVPKFRHVENMDGSYILDTPDEDLLHSDSISGSMAVKNENLLNLKWGEGRSNVEDDDDDDESFIRSPIGGNKKFMSAAHPQSNSQSRLLSGTPFSQGKPLSSLSLRAMSHTSTPGMVLSNTSVPVTPIVADDSMQVFVNDTLDDTGSHIVTETPSILKDVRTNVSQKTILPEASLVFGHPVSTRPVPGHMVNWPSRPGTLTSKIQVMIKSVLFYTLPTKFISLIRDFYSHAFEIYKDELNGSTLDDSNAADQKQFHSINSKLDSMGLMELISGSAVTEIVHSQIEKHIDEECKGNFDTSFIKDLETWLDQQVLGWLKHIYSSKQTASQVASVNAFRGRLRHFIYEKYGKCLISQFFDIIIDFPDSKPAIVDLSTCLEKTDLRSELVSSLKNALESRLLHPGVNTAVILTAYIAAIKSLRLLEPAGVILELVCEPVGRYLRSREDTVRCIVASLTDDGNNELVSELINTKPLSEENDDEDGHAYPRWEEWKPDPVDADPSSGSRFRRSADILSTLVNIYGSKELFVNEYRALLADRILMQYNYDVERELRYLELLKLRFGEAQLHFCEVMLRDVAESRRVNSRIQEAVKAEKRDGEEEPKQEQGQKEIELNAMILSAQFWPAFRDEKIKLPEELQTHLDKYTRSFEHQKQNRTLVWKPHLGIMNIDIDFNGETLSFSVSPVQAAIIMKFQERSEWSLTALSQELEMTPTILRRKLAFWQGHGLVREEGHEMYVLVRDRAGTGGSTQVDVEEEVESAMASAQQLKEEEMQILWTYIQGMLANLDCLTLERIHAMLRMFATEEPGSEVSLQELKAFLDIKVKDQVLIFSSGVYRLNK